MLKTLDVVAAIIEKDDKILLAQRPAHADQPGMWEFAGGKVEAGETQPEALIRELREELGIEAGLRNTWQATSGKSRSG
jgi:(d)CTP diphosphatase